MAIHGGNRPSEVSFFLKLACERGTLIATPRRPGMYLHWTDWNITANGEPVPVPAAYRTVPDAVPSGPAVRIAALYRDTSSEVDWSAHWNAYARLPPTHQLGRSSSQVSRFSNQWWA
ncbi:hypothetical protein ACGF4C_14195 [Streptomyces sp. NPDC048197]|uniref:hypothetical protein n=1 Tax=Streptomyces sp. NPDC048197 TaxID=3365511 RepID=UPI00371E9DDA